VGVSTVGETLRLASFQPLASFQVGAFSRTAIKNSRISIRGLRVLKRSHEGATSIRRLKFSMHVFTSTIIRWRFKFLFTSLV
jgi:hypothetical protein